MNGGRSRRAVTALGSAALALVFSLAFAPLASANHFQACSQPEISPRFAGEYKTTLGDINGVAGRTAALSLAICTSATDNDRVNAVWISISPEIDATGDSIIQAGRLKCITDDVVLCNGTNKKFWAWGRSSTSPGCAGWTSVAPSGEPIGAWSSGSDSWIVSRDGSNWNIIEDGLVVDQLAVGNICWSTVHSIQNWSGESFDLGDAIGGEVAAKFRVDNAQKRVTGGNWIAAAFNAPCTPAADYPGNCTVVSNTAIDIWSAH